jgi:hypothetical protein
MPHEARLTAAAMSEINFQKIAARGGSVENAFEELCCQLAAKTRPAGARFERFWGAGGDGGVECKVISVDGTSTGWQAKYLFEIDELLKQASKSLKTALAVHTDITEYVVCFPFDLTGKTGRKGKSQTEKFDAWASKAEAEAKATGRTLTIERYPAHAIQEAILANDSSGGLRQYFFSATTFSDQWFAKHIATAKHTAGPRYNRELDLKTPLTDWFSSFAGGNDWQSRLTKLIKACRRETAQLERLVASEGGDPMRPEWPAATLEKARKAVAQCKDYIAHAEKVGSAPTEAGLTELDTALAELIIALLAIENELASDLDKKHGEGTADSKRWRSFMAEYEVSFPAANLDGIRDTLQAGRAIGEWLSSPAGFLAFRQLFVLSGSGGSGKTHGLCDIAQHRLEEGAYTCLAFGHQFSGEPDPWTRLAESLGVRLTLGRDGLLDALNAAAECSGKKLIICIDAINETRPRSYWSARISEFAAAVASRPNLKLCISCRTSFLPVCLPKAAASLAVEHRGFAGMEREACNAFFSHYQLESPLVPVLQPELANPLYLKLVCETLRGKGLKQLPKGWFGIAPVIRAFLSYKEEQFAAENSVSEGAAVVSGSLRAISSAIAQSGNASLRWSEAQAAIEAAKPQAKGLNALQWLVTADLLIEDGPSSDTIGAENVIRPAFERFGDVLVASEMLEGLSNDDIGEVFREGEKLADLVKTAEDVGENAGVLSALSVLVPEKLRDTELSRLVSDDSVRCEMELIVVRTLPSRTAETLLLSTRDVLGSVLNSPNAYEAMDAMLAVSTQESDIDAHWLHSVLGRLFFTMRDSFWSGYLKRGYENNTIVRRIIEAATDIDLQKVDLSTTERWCIVLLWFTAAADRRVKDYATRAAVGILRAHPALIPELVQLCLGADDDEVRERALLVAYGALILSRNEGALKKTAEHLLEEYARTPEYYENAMMRDHMRCIAEFAAYVGCLDKKFDPTLPNHRNPKVPRPEAPPQDQVKAWERDEHRGTRLLVRSCLADDFNHYSIECLRGWSHAMLKPAIGGWIVRRILTDFRYRDSKCGDYDTIVTGESGGGRGKPTWAERIGKKYQWVAMYQLASRLYDSTDRERDRFERRTRRLPLILNEERKLDPTILRRLDPDAPPRKAWWIRDSVDLAATAKMTYAEWVKEKSDLPKLESLLQPFTHSGQRWLLLEAYDKSSEYSSERPYREPYRHTWVSVESFLVPKAEIESAVARLDGLNFLGRNMPNGARWLYVFAGEYPWAAACNVETDEWLGYDEVFRDESETLPKLVPTWNQITSEWEYDAALGKSRYFQVPGRMLFKDQPLWWNGYGGFTHEEKIVFCDPGGVEGGPSSLVADVEYLRPQTDALGYSLLWCVVGQKQILGDDDTRSMSFSQIAWLARDGSFRVGKRKFFPEPYESPLRRAVRGTGNKKQAKKSLARPRRKRRSK